jgi:alpha-beta hydrolase superfamily lysophospholipase
MQSFDIDHIIESFGLIYKKRLGNYRIQSDVINNNGYRHEIISPVLRGKGNYPCILSHNKFTDHVVILTHGLSDSPYYMEAIGWRFFNAGANIIFPLLYGHGLKYPDKALQEWGLYQKWKFDIDETISVAKMMGRHISLGGLSTGGALSLNAVLRYHSQITGGLFLFSAALEIGTLYENIGIVPLVQTYYRTKQEKLAGYGPNPYKYPIFSNFSGLQLARLIQENKKLIKNFKIKQPVFVAHSIQDATTLVSGVIDLLNKHVENGVAYLISSFHDDQPLAHGDLVLDKPIKLLSGYKYQVVAPRANPKFDDMMCAAIQFFESYKNIKENQHED